MSPLLAARGLLSGLTRCTAVRSSHQLRSTPLFSSSSHCSRPAMAAAAAGSSGGASDKPIIRAVCFDMDGTLTVPVIDFALMRRRVGVTQGDILDVINGWPEEERRRAYDAIAEIEQQALADMKLMPGILELCDLLDSAGVPRGLITRNVKSSVEYFHTNAFAGRPPFEPAISRECAFPYKPSPEALLHACRSWGVRPSECMMVGDSAKDDIVCGRRAGALTVLLDIDGRYAPGSPAAPDGEAVPHHRVASMGDLRDLLTQRYRLLPPERDEAAAAAESAAAAGSN